MRIDGKAMADNILANLEQDIKRLKKRGIIPTLAVILIGDNPASLSYIKQKQKTTERIGAKLVLNALPLNTSLKLLKLLIKKLNDDPLVHGLIVQRPLPPEAGECGEILNLLNPAKDVDGLVPRPRFEAPVSKAVLKILEQVYKLNPQSSIRQLTDKAQRSNQDPNPNDQFLNWLRSKQVVVVGRGETAGKAIASLLQKQHCTTSIIHSQTPHPKKILQQADIVISCVGKKRVVKATMIKPGLILIGVGIWRDSDGKLHGDYEEEEIKDIASFYTPTPGGVGPLNVACLMENLIQAALNESDQFTNPTNLPIKRKIKEF